MTGPDAAGDGPTVRLARPRARWAFRIVVGAVLVGLVLVGGTAFRVWQVARADDSRPADAIVVLGAAQYDGEPSSIFSWRLRHAEQLWADGVAPLIVTTGGSQAGDAYTEAEAGRDYLVGRGVPADAILVVGEGTDTLGSLRAVAAEGADWGEIVLVSDPWHSLRARTMARDLGLDAWTSPTRSGPVVQTRGTQFRYIFRETGALLFYRLTHASVDARTTGLG